MKAGGREAQNYERKRVARDMYSSMHFAGPFLKSGCWFFENLSQEYRAPLEVKPRLQSSLRLLRFPDSEYAPQVLHMKTTPNE